jgi:hypothetical protein
LKPSNPTSPAFRPNAAAILSAPAGWPTSSGNRASWKRARPRAILEGRHPRDLGADKLLGHSRLPLTWPEQRRVLGFA